MMSVRVVVMKRVCISRSKLTKHIASDKDRERKERSFQRTKLEMASPGTDLTMNTIREGGSAVGSYTLPPGRPTRSRGCVLTLPLEWLKRLRHLSSTSPASCGPRAHGVLVPGISPAFVGNGCGQGQAGGL